MGEPAEQLAAAVMAEEVADQPIKLTNSIVLDT
jgi:hypothetical protein